MQQPLNQYVLVIAQLEARVEVFARTNNWQSHVLTRLDDVLDLSDLGGAAAAGGGRQAEISIPLFRLYAGTPVVPSKPAGV